MEGKKWWQSNTIRINLGIIIAGIGTIVSGEINWQTAVMPMVVALIAIIMRAISKEPIV